MKTIQSETENSRVSEPCCDESKLKHMNTVVRCTVWASALLLVALFALGYFLNPSALRIVWLVISGTLLVIALPLITFWKKWKRQCTKDCETED